MRGLVFWLVWVIGGLSVIVTAEPRTWHGGSCIAAEGQPASARGDRLAYLQEVNPYYVGTGFPRLVTPQWVGEPGVEAVIVLAIDDMRGHPRWEAYLRPILERLKQIDGRAACSIMTCQIDPAEPHLQTWLAEGVSLETHTVDHPCPLLAGSDFAKAKSTFDRCVDTLASVPGNMPVAFRMPCCDSLNTPSPRFYAEIFNRTTPSDRFLAVDSSVFNVFTSDDPRWPRELVLDADGRERFTKYVPVDRSFVNTIENYPYPYVLGRLCWEFPCVTPSDWQGFHIAGPANPRTLADLKAALDLTVAAQGTFNLVFHPYEWIRNDQVVELIDYAVQTYGPKVKFLSFKEALARLNEQLLAGQSLRDERGHDNGVRLADLNDDGHLDVLIGNHRLRRTRVWQPTERKWSEFELPCDLAARPSFGGEMESTAGLGVVAENQVFMLYEDTPCASRWTSDGWKACPELLPQEIKDRPLLGLVPYVRHYSLRDLDGDGSCELIDCTRDHAAVFRWDATGKTWSQLAWSLPEGAWIPDFATIDSGLRFVDIDEDGQLDAFFADEDSYRLDLFESMETGWGRPVLHGKRGENPGGVTIPPIAVASQNNGAFFHSRHVWWQNETTDRLPNLVDRRSFDELLGNVAPAAKSPEASLKCMVPRSGFTVELVAAEPLIADPVAFAWGADGRLWVAEMGDYPSGGGENSTGGGRIRWLEDIDGDGRCDRSTVFLDGLKFPSGVMPWRKGVLITAAPDILYAEDTDHDGKADLRQTLFTGFGEGNQQHRVNGLRWGLDHWIYGANGDSGGVITCVATGEGVELGGRDFRIRPDQGLLDPQTGLTQFGRERDDWGNWFGSNNANPMYHFVLDDYYLRRNPHLVAPRTRVDVSVAPGAAPVYPASRTLARFNDFNAANRFTSACSAIVYRDELFGPEYEDNSFVSEPVHNLVHREVLTPAGVTFTSRRAADEAQTECLRARDNWFRPTMLRTGPDGALWVADMYRLVIEHPEYIPAETRERLDFRAGDKQGRIYRVYPRHSMPRPIPKLGDLDANGLVSALDSPSGWQRDMAHQLIYERQELACVEGLRAMARRNDVRPATRLTALCALDGLAALDDQTLSAALADEHPAVRRHAVRLAEPIVNNEPRLAQRLAEMVADPDPQVRLQLAYSLGAWNDRRSTEALGRLAAANATDPFITSAVLSSLSAGRTAGVLEALMSAADKSPDLEARRACGELVSQVTAMAVAMRDFDGLAIVVPAIVAPASGGKSNWRLATAGALLIALDEANLSLADLAVDAPDSLHEALRGLSRLTKDARLKVLDRDVDVGERLAALVLAARAGPGEDGDLALFVELLGPQTPGELTLAALDALSTREDDLPANVILSAWSGLAPAQRSRALDVLLSRGTWSEALLDALQSSQVAAAEMHAVARQRLTERFPSDSRVTKILGGSSNPNRDDLITTYRKGLDGDPGDANRGRDVFRKSCAACHRLEQVGHALGPDLAALSDRSLIALLTSVFDPNRGVETRYLNYTVTTTEGQVHTGMLIDQSGNSLTLSQGEGKQVTLLRGRIDQLFTSGKSVMPEGLEKDISIPAMSDLAAYLHQQRPSRKEFAGNRPERVAAEKFRGEYWLLASEASVYGSTLVYEPVLANLGYWQSTDDHALWEFDVRMPGTFHISLDYACPDSEAGNTYVVELGEHRYQGLIEATGNWEAYREHEVGKVTLTPGVYQLCVRAAEPLRGCLMDLKAVRLRPDED